MSRKITTVLFDLDGTLLPMDQERFARGYFGRLTRKMSAHGYDPKQFMDAIWAGTAAMIKNDGKATNEEVFFRTFSKVCGKDVARDLPYFYDFYKNEFNEVKSDCGFTPEAKETVELVKSLGLRIALATNPLFPAIATECRIRWCNLEPSDFELYTTYENSSYCKPNPDYYRFVTEKLGVTPDECLMVGNDVGEDMIAEELGMRVFLLTDCLINWAEKDIDRYPHGSFAELHRFLKNL